MSVSVNPATNRITNQGTSYDANGNLTAMPGLTMTYDMTNRMISATSDSNGTDTYVYDPAGHRVFRNGYLDFYGVDGSLLGEYSPGWPDGFTACNVSVYFGKRMLWRGWGYNFFTSGETINADRLGSAVYDWTDAPKYFPYGDEPTTTQQNRPKFATYTRDATTALDYAQQRYYASTLGRFTTPDLSGLGAAGSEPQSWNRYAYVENDPANFNDPTGELRWLDSLDGGGVYVLPIVFVVNVFRSIFGGGPKDPAILWKLSAATEVRKWDQKIADAIKKGEEDEQKRRYVKALWVVDDCYERNRLGMPIRRITYMAKDQSDQPFQRGEYVVAEQQYVVKGSLTGRGVWGYTQQNPDGTFDDFIGLQAPWVAEVTTYQTFTATMVNPTGYLPGVPRPVMVVYPGYPNGPYFGVLGHWMSKAGDRMNGAWGDPAGRRDCTTPRYSGI
jgi:RHS repeat-associated protein